MRPAADQVKARRIAASVKGRVVLLDSYVHRAESSPGRTPFVVEDLLNRPRSSPTQLHTRRLQAFSPTGCASRNRRSLQYPARERESPRSAAQLHSKQVSDCTLMIILP